MASVDLSKVLLVGIQIGVGMDGAGMTILAPVLGDTFVKNHWVRFLTTCNNNCNQCKYLNGICFKDNFEGKTA